MITPCPGIACGYMAHCLDIPYLIIYIFLCIISHCHGVSRVHVLHKGSAIPIIVIVKIQGNIIFPAGSFCQTVYGIVGIFGKPGYFLVVKKHNRNIVIYNTGNIAYGVEGIMPILQRIIFPFGFKPYKAEGFWVIRKFGEYIVTVNNFITLTFLVIVNVLDVGSCEVWVHMGHRF